MFPLDTVVSFLCGSTRGVMCFAVLTLTVSGIEFVNKEHGWLPPLTKSRNCHGNCNGSN